MNERVRLQPVEIYWLMIAPLAVLNFLFPLIAWGTQVGWLVSLFVGMLLGQWNWLAVWAVFGQSPWKNRLLEVLSGMLALFLSLYAGLASHERIAPRDLAEVVCLFPLALVATQSPLWLLRFFLAWRIRPQQRSTNAVADDARRFDLRHIFAATAVVAVSLGAARGAGSAVETLPSILIGLPLITLFTAVPCICTGMIVADLVKANIALAAYILAVPGIALAVVSLDHNAIRPWELIASLSGFMCGMAIVVHTGLRLIRAQGFVMTAPRATAEKRADAGGVGQIN